MPKEAQARLKAIQANGSDYNQSRIDVANALLGNLKGSNCDICKNKGIIYLLDDAGYEVYRECECMPSRRSWLMIEKSGLKNVLDIKTFDNYAEKTDWQKKVKSTARLFVKDTQKAWFFIGGQVGCGKTHICTAIAAEFLKQGKSVRYMLWRDEILRLCANITDNEEYHRIVSPLKTVDVLYIDDLFYMPIDELGRRKSPSQGFVTTTFEIINSRYMANKTTIISCMMSSDELIDLSEDIGSRIYERTKHGTCINIGKDKSKNWRLTS
jgi:DNA replication protein DnaC